MLIPLVLLQFAISQAFAVGPLLSDGWTPVTSSKVVQLPHQYVERQYPVQFNDRSIAQDRIDEQSLIQTLEDVEDQEEQVLEEILEKEKKEELKQTNSEDDAHSNEEKAPLIIYPASYSTPEEDPQPQQPQSVEPVRPRRPPLPPHMRGGRPQLRRPPPPHVLQGLGRQNEEIGGPPLNRYPPPRPRQPLKGPPQRPIHEKRPPPPGLKRPRPGVKRPFRGPPRPRPSGPPPPKLASGGPPPTASTGIISSIANIGADIKCAAKDLAADIRLSDTQYMEQQIRCVLNDGPCDDVGFTLRRLAPEIIRGNCPRPCDKCKKKQIENVIGTLSREYPKQWSEMLSAFG